MSKITDIMKKRTTFSLEVFPPKKETGMPKLMETLDALYKWNPDWVSCTYGAGGSAKGLNVDICQSIIDAGKTRALSHYTCVHNHKDNIVQDFRNYMDMGVKDFLVLRGDFLPGENATHGDFNHADQLIAFLREKFGTGITIACSGLPEGHILSKDRASDTTFLRRKQDLGADFIITQLCYDMDSFKSWLDEIHRAGVNLPIVVGVMPVLNVEKCIRYCVSMNGSAIPRSLARVISRYYYDPEGFREAGMDYTVQQMYEYLQLGVNGIHVYTLNQYKDVEEILKRSGLFTKTEE